MNRPYLPLPAAQQSSDAPQLLFLAPDVEDQAVLVAAVRPGVEVIRLDSERDGVQQIADHVAERSGVTAVHIVSHGRPGEVRLPHAALNRATLPGYADALTRISHALAPDGEICLYGCQVGAGTGRDFVAELAAVTGAGVAASDNLTGAAELGGDWDLDVRTGSATTGAIAFVPQRLNEYRHVLVFTFSTPAAFFYNDSYLYDDFKQSTGFVAAISDTNPNDAMTYRLSVLGVIQPDDGVTSTYTNAWGTLSLTMATGAYFFEPNDAYINGLSGNQSGFPNAFEAAVLRSFGVNVQATDQHAHTDTSTIWGFASNGVNDNPATVANAPSADITIGAGAALNYAFPVGAHFLRVDNTNTGDPGTGIPFSDTNVTAYLAYVGTNEATFTSTQTDDTFTENEAYKAGATALPSWLSFTAVAGSDLAHPGTITFTGTAPTNVAGTIVNVMVVGTDSPTNGNSVRRHVGEHFVIYVDGTGNDAPLINSATAVSVAENQTTVMTVTALDPDAGATQTFSLVGGADQALFSINASTGVLSFLSAKNFESPGDVGGNNVYNVTVRATDNNGLTNDAAIAVTVTDVDEFAPVITSNGGGDTAAISVATGTPIATPVTTVTATDGDTSGTKTFTLGGKDMAQFAINASTGVLTFKATPNFAAPTDAGANNVYDLTVMAYDGQLYDTQSIAVTVTGGGNTAPVITSNGGGASATVSIAENSTAVTTVTATDAEGGTLTYSVSGADAAKFTINASTGVLAFASAPNFESPTDTGANNVYDLTVTVSDGALTDTQAIAVTVTNVNEFTPTITSDGGGATATISVSENQTAVTTVTATDGDANTTLAYTLGGTDAAKFTLNVSTGVLAFAAVPNFETPSDSGADNIYDVTVTVSDGSLTDTQAIAVTVTDANDAPVITSDGAGASASISLAENTSAVTTVTATDEDAGATQTYSLGGADAAKFTIDASTGVLAFASAPDFETPTDAGANNIYDVTVTVSDGALTDTQALAVTVTDVNEFAPSISSNGGGASASITMSENLTAVSTVVATDADANSVLSYSISGGADAAKFSLVSSTGVLSFVTAPDFETPTDSGADNVYDVIVTASDGALTDTQTIAVTITNTVNETPPSITSNAGGPTASISIAENTTAVTTVTSTDPDPGATASYSLIGGADAAKFQIDANSGVLTFVAAPNFETATDAGANNVYDLTVQVADGIFTDTQAIAVTVTNANDAPVITSNGAGASASISVAENTTAVTTVTSTDDDAGATKTFTLGGTDAAKFTINASTGVLAFTSAPNFETPTDTGGNNVYDVTVTVTDNGALTDTQALAVTVTNANDAPVITSNGAGASASISIAENSTAVTTATSTDEDAGATKTFTLGGTDAAKFTLNASTGVLAFTSAPNFETPTDTGANNIYDLTVTVTDNGALTDTQALAVTVTDVNEAPTITSNGAGASTSISIAENLTAVTTVTSSDPDAGATKTFTLGGTDAAKFTLNASTGVLAFTSAPNFETPTDSGVNNIYDVTVTVSDGALTDTQAIAITVTDVDQAITSNGGGASASVSVVTGTTAVTTVTSTDNSATRAFSLVGGADQGKFLINASTGALSFASAPNLASPTDVGGNNVYDVTVQVADDVDTDTQAIAVTVVSPNSPPTANPDTVTTTEDAATSVSVLANDTDPQGNNTITTVLLAAAASTKGAALSVAGTAVNYTPGTGFQSLKAGETTTDTFGYTAQDAGGLQSSSTVTVTITGVNDAPVAVADTLAVSEDGTLTASTALLANDTDPDSGDTRTLTSVGGAAANIGQVMAGQYGSFLVAADGSATYTLDNANTVVQGLKAGQNLTETLAYEIADAAGAPSSAAVTVTIAGQDDAPVAGDDGVTYVEGSGVLEIKVADLLGNDSDSDSGDLISFVSVANSSRGATLSVTNGVISYDPGAAFDGLKYGDSDSDSFTYTIRDVAGNTATGSVALTVLGTAAATQIVEEGETFTLDGHTYELSTTARTWSDANATAIARGGHLASLATAAENTAVAAALATLLAGNTAAPSAADGGGASYLWLGANDIAKEGSFVWSDGSTFADTAWGSGDGGHEPDNFTSKTLAPQGQDGVGLALGAWPTPAGGIGSAGQWNDLAVTDKLWSLVEYDNDTGAAQLSGVAGSNDFLIDPSGQLNLIGGKGDDTYIVDHAGQSIVEKAGEGNDTVVTTLAAYTLGDNLERLRYTGAGDFSGTGNGLANVITGNAGDDLLSGQGGNDTLNGNAGDDSLIGGLGADTMNGGAGNDTYDVDSGGDRVVEAADGGIDTVVAHIALFSLAGFAQVENLRFEGSGKFTGTGNGLANQIAGGDGADVLSGAAGNDTLTGGAGNDTLNGNAGDDTLLGGDGNDALFGGDVAGNVGSDTVVLAGNRADYTFSRITNSALNPQVKAVRTVAGVTESDTLTGIEKVRFADSVTDASLTLDDLLKNTGSPFADAYLDDDNVATTVSFSGLAGNDTITGGARANTLDGGDGNDTIAGGGGDDLLTGGAGNDTLDGGSGNDTMGGGLGNDLYLVDSAGDGVNEGLSQGTDTVWTTLAGYALADNVERVEFKGAGDFSGSGNALVNTLVGGSGNDTLDGGAGADRLDGGLGDDTYVVDNALDVIANDGGGIDTVRSTVTRTLTGGLDDLVLLDGGTSPNLNGSGNELANRITGNAGNNLLSGLAGDDSLSGGAGNDSLSGGLGDDVLNGGTGRDVLSGGAGSDHFVFDLLAGDPTLADLVSDFVGHGASTAAQTAGIDTIALSGAVFSALTWTDGVLDPAQFRADKDLQTAGTAEDRLLYDTKSGKLFYDADGSGSDSQAVLVATFGSGTAHPGLSAADFSLV